MAAILSRGRWVNWVPMTLVFVCYQRKNVSLASVVMNDIIIYTVNLFGKAFAAIYWIFLLWCGKAKNISKLVNNAWWIFVLPYDVSIVLAIFIYDVHIWSNINNICVIIIQPSILSLVYEIFQQTLFLQYISVWDLDYSQVCILCRVDQVVWHTNACTLWLSYITEDGSKCIFLIISFQMSLKLSLVTNEWYCFKKLLGAETATGYHLHRSWHSSMKHICVTRPQNVTAFCSALLMGHSLPLASATVDEDIPATYGLCEEPTNFQSPDSI